MHFRRFQSRILAFVLGLLIAVQASALFAVSVAMTRNARAQLRDELAVGGRVFTRLIRTRTEQLADASRLLSGDFAFKTAVSTADRPTVLSVLENHQARIGADLIMLAALDGTLAADTRPDHPEGAPFPFPRLLDRAEATGEASAIVMLEGRLYQLVVVPLLAPLPLAWICVGFPVDDAVARDLQQLTMLQVSFLRAGPGGGFTALASTLQPALRDELVRELPADIGDRDTSLAVTLGSAEYEGLATSIGEYEAGRIVVVLQRSLDDALRLSRPLHLTLIVIFAAGLVLSVGGAIVVARRVTRPVKALVESARRVERGDYGHAVAVDQRDEIGELATTFNLMTEGLAERDRVRAELERVGRLKRFLSPQLAELVVSSGDQAVLASHRREITVVFADLRGFTAFADTADPEEVMNVLGQYHGAVGPLVFHFEGTLERFAGDGLMVFFNDPVPCPDPAARAVRMALAMRDRVTELTEAWRLRGHSLGFGVGVAMGYATLGPIGFEGRFDYAAIGRVTNLSSRLCDEARNGQILVSQRVYAEVHELVEAEPVGELSLKGFTSPESVLNVLKLRAPVES